MCTESVRSGNSCNPVSVALDDFGTGFSSLSNLRQYPITTLKVDKSFVKDILHDPGDAAITWAVVAMGRSLDITVVAEVVESVQHAEFLLRMGYDEAGANITDERFRQNEFRRCLRQAKVSNPREKPAEGRYASIENRLPW